MIIIKMNGGLGNQLQQYALYEKFRSLGKEARLDISWYGRDTGLAIKRERELDYFPRVNYETCKEEETNHIEKSSFWRKVLAKIHLVEKNHYVENEMYDEEIFRMDNKVLEGYWACEAYYADIIPVLRQKLVFPESQNSQNKEMEDKMRQCNSVSVHLRRGDYLTAENAQMFGGICTDAYYNTAIEYVKIRVPNARFFVFSDDPDYAKEKYSGTEYTIVDINRGKDSFFDMYLMTCCKHNICANSTFSFWGARLNANENKMMIRPLKQKNCDWYVPEKMKLLWKNWILIDEEGKIR